MLLLYQVDDNIDSNLINSYWYLVRSIKYYFEVSSKTRDLRYEYHIIFNTRTCTRYLFDVINQSSNQYINQ